MSWAGVCVIGDRLHVIAATSCIYPYVRDLTKEESHGHQKPTSTAGAGLKHAH
jgi:hypothetical protein